MDRLIGKMVKARTRFSWRFEPAAIVLMYHRISDVAVEPNWLAVSVKNFYLQMKHIRDSYRPISLPDLVNAVRIRKLPPRSVAITFDDGYVDNLTNALPILESLNIPATVFVTTGFVDSEHEFWWDELSYHVLEVPDVPCTLSLDLGDRQNIWSTTTTEDRQHTFQDIKELIKPIGKTGQDMALARIAEWSGAARRLRSAYRTMTSSELKALAQSNVIEIGAHTITHPILPTLSAEAQHDEIVGSRRWLERRLDRPISMFSYPNGDFDDETATIVAEAGFEVACTTRNGCVSAGQDLFRLNRCGVNDWDIVTFQRNLSDFFTQPH
jgi:peptidoglycan/xylan/chitin deacetylase (PgdA/CDA1 family)